LILSLLSIEFLDTKVSNVPAWLSVHNVHNFRQIYVLGVVS